MRAIQELLGAQLIGKADTLITGLSSLETAEAGDLAFLASDRFLKAAQSSRAGALIAARPVPDVHCPLLVVDHPAYAFARVAQQLFVEPYRARGIAPDLMRGEAVSIGPDVSIWPRVTLGDRVSIGARVTLFPGVFVGDDSVIGDGCHITPGALIAGNCRIGTASTVGMGAAVLFGTRIGDSCLVHNNATVNSNVPDRTEVFGDGRRGIRPA